MHKESPGHYLEDVIANAKEYFQDSKEKPESHPWTDETSAWFRRFVLHRHEIHYLSKGPMIMDWVIDKDRVRHEITISDTLYAFRDLVPKRDTLINLFRLLCLKIEKKIVIDKESQ